MDFEQMVRKYTKYRFPFKIILGWVKFAVRVLSFPGLRNHHSWVDPKQNLSSSLPINVELQGEDIPLPEEVVHEFIEKSSHRWIMNVCGCRYAYSCENHSQDIGCLFLGESVLDTLPGLGRFVSKEEAHEHVKRAVAEKLIPCVGRAKIDHFLLNIKDKGKLLAVCFCCHCCCIAGFYKNLPIEQLNGLSAPIKGLDLTVSDACTGCGTCIQYCIHDAVTIENGKSVRTDYCRLCGRCAMYCPSNAVKITLNNPDFKDEMIREFDSYTDVT